MLSIYRVIVHFSAGVADRAASFMAERGALAKSPGQALDLVLEALQIDLNKVDSIKTIVEKPTSLDCFSYDAAMMRVIGCKSLNVKELWEQRGL